LDAAFAAEHAAPEQRDRLEEDVWTDPIATWLDTGIPAYTFSNLRQPIDQNAKCWIRVTISEILLGALNIPVEMRDKIRNNRVVAVLTSLKWEMHKSGPKRWYWRPGYYKSDKGNSPIGFVAEPEGKPPNPG
jgi:hypothetical protein